MSSDARVREYRAARRASSVRIDDDTLIWNEGAEQLHHLNASATLVWEALGTWSTAEGVNDRISRAARLDAAAVRQCIEALYEAGVVEGRVRPATHAPSSSSSRS